MTAIWDLTWPVLAQVTADVIGAGVITCTAVLACCELARWWKGEQ